MSTPKHQWLTNVPCSPRILLVHVHIPISIGSYVFSPVVIEIFVCDSGIVSYSRRQQWWTNRSRCSPPVTIGWCSGAMPTANQAHQRWPTACLTGRRIMISALQPEINSNTFLKTPQGWVLVLSTSPAQETTTMFLLDLRKEGRPVTSRLLSHSKSQSLCYTLTTTVAWEQWPSSTKCSCQYNDGI